MKNKKIRELFSAFITNKFMSHLIAENAALIRRK